MRPFDIDNSDGVLRVKRRLQPLLAQLACLLAFAGGISWLLSGFLIEPRPGQGVPWPLWAFVLFPLLMPVGWALSRLPVVGETFTFDRRRDRVCRNGRHLADLSEVTAVRTWEHH